jgi:hypothetical protein
MTAQDDWPKRLAKAAQRLAAARAEETAARQHVRELAIAAIAAGQTEAGVARALGVNRMAVREWLGKRRR